MKVKDLIVVGGGINGAGIAADAAGRGLSVLMIEKDDLASATSSSSSKLIHGGLRYLEYYKFRLVREALAEREILLKIAPHIIYPLRFFLPYLSHYRSYYLIKMGLFIYDILGKRKNLAKSKSIICEPKLGFDPKIINGFEYSDCWVDDSRLVVLNALEVLKHKGSVITRTKVINAYRKSGLWRIKAKNIDNGKIYFWIAKGLVNATGPWVNNFFNKILKIKSPYNIRLVKGSHIVIPILKNQKKAYILQNDDKRIIFIIPWMNKFSIIGTTDIEYNKNPKDVKINKDEIKYLLNIYNKYFCKKLKKSDIIWTFSGVRPLFDDKSKSPQSITRDYTIKIQDEKGKAPLLSVFGGKLTTYRKMAETSLNKLSKYYKNIKSPWTKNCILPGGENIKNINNYSFELINKYPFLSKEMSYRYASTYGSRSEIILENTSKIEDLGECLGYNFYYAELQYLINHEWAYKLDDIIWRRTKLGLFLNENQKKKISKYLKQK